MPRALTMVLHRHSQQQRVDVVAHNDIAPELRRVLGIVGVDVQGVVVHGQQAKQVIVVLGRARGQERHRRTIACPCRRALPPRCVQVVPWLANRLDALESMDEVKSLDVRPIRLDRWPVDGLLCLGDAAHAMSPVGGVGTNLGIQDAVAAAGLLARPLQRGTINA